MTGEAASSEPISMAVIRSLRTFAKTTKFKATVLNLMTHTLSEEDIDNLKKSFAAMDENKDGKITLMELSKAMLKFDHAVVAEEIERVMKAADIDEDGVISYNELMLTFVQRKLNAKEERLWDSFCKMDLNGDGRITVDELRSVLGQEADERKVKELIAEVDHDKNGSVDYDEFLALWLPAPAEDGNLDRMPSNRGIDHPIVPKLTAARATASKAVPTAAAQKAPEPAKPAPTTSCCTVL